MPNALFCNNPQWVWYKPGCGSLQNPTLYLRIINGGFEGSYNLEPPLLFYNTFSSNNLPNLFIENILTLYSSVFSEFIEMNFYQKKSL